MQVLAIVVAAIVARTHAEQEVDEADLSLAYSGGSGRVSPFSTFWLSVSCIRHVRPGEHASNSVRRDQHILGNLVIASILWQDFEVVTSLLSNMS